MKNAMVRAGTVSLLILTSGCSVLEGDKVEYKSASTVKASSLDVPPDLTRPTADPRYVIPASGSVLATDYQGRPVAAASTTSPAVLGTLRMERLGNQRWLVDNRPPEAVWESLSKFWKDNGFILIQDDRALGIMETDWAENRAKIPQDFIRNTIGKLLDGLYSSAERDKFRTRLERNAQGGTDIFVSHRGMEEVNRSKVTSSELVWVPRANSPELETEFLRRMMLALGANQNEAAAAVKAPSQTLTSRAAVENGVSVAQLDDGFDRAWRRVGLSLDRTGFTVEDRDRSQGLYYVRYVEPTPEGGDKEPGFWARWLGGAKQRMPVKYRIQVKASGTGSSVTVLNDKGLPETSPVAKQIVDLLVADLK